jgi:tetratricopeptide (TPR) repeat protein
VAVRQLPHPRALVGRAPESYAEVVVGLALVACVLWGGLHAWQFYDQRIRPLARTVTVPAAVRGVRADDPQEVRRWQAVLDNLGEANSDIAAKHWDWALSALQRVLELDPENPDAAALLLRMELEPPPALTPGEEAARLRQTRVAELLGAAASFRTAGRPDDARALLGEALALDPVHQQAQEMLESLAAGR